MIALMETRHLCPNRHCRQGDPCRHHRLPDHMARSRAGPRSVPGQGDQRKPPTGTLLRKGAWGAPATSSLQRRHLVVRDWGTLCLGPSPQEHQSPEERKMKGRAPSEPGGVQKTSSQCTQIEQWPPTHLVDRFHQGCGERLQALTSPGSLSSPIRKLKWEDSGHCIDRSYCSFQKCR